MELAGWIILSLLCLFLMVASVTPKLLKLDAAVRPLNDLGFEKRLVFTIGLLEAVITIFIFVPQTAVIGGVLMMGLLGGAIASQLRVNAPLFSHTLFGVYLGIWMWLGIWLRDPNVFYLMLAYN